MREDKLIRRIEQGDTTAADELVKTYYPEILKYCIWHAPNLLWPRMRHRKHFQKVSPASSAQSAKRRGRKIFQ